MHFISIRLNSSQSSNEVKNFFVLVLFYIIGVWVPLLHSRHFHYLDLCNSFCCVATYLSLLLHAGNSVKTITRLLLVTYQVWEHEIVLPKNWIIQLNISFTSNFRRSNPKASNCKLLSQHIRHRHFHTRLVCWQVSWYLCHLSSTPGNEMHVEIVAWVDPTRNNHLLTNHIRPGEAYN